MEKIAARYGPGRRPTLRQIEQEGYLWARQGIFDQKSASAHIKKYQRTREAGILRSRGRRTPAGRRHNEAQARQGGQAPAEPVLRPSQLAEQLFVVNAAAAAQHRDVEQGRVAVAAVDQAAGRRTHLVPAHAPQQQEHPGGQQGGKDEMVPPVEVKGQGVDHPGGCRAIEGSGGFADFFDGIWHVEPSSLLVLLEYTAKLAEGQGEERKLRRFRAGDLLRGSPGAVPRTGAAPKNGIASLRIR